jgi:negative regulator of sigma E activity
MASLAAVLAAVVVGISIDRWILSPAAPGAPVAATAGSGGAEQAVPVAYVTDPRYQHERAQLLRSVNARLARLPPASRQKVRNSLATIHQSIHDIQQALGREPGNALLQELLIDSYQNEMQVLSTVQEASGGGGET